MRKLCTVRTIDDLQPIDGKDRIVVAKIDGWNCIVPKGQFNIGDYCMFFEIDSMIPTDDPRIKFLVDARRGLRIFEGKEYCRIKTMKMGGQISQGLVLPINIFPEVDLSNIQEDYSDVLQVIKYEIPEFTGGVRIGRPAGDFPFVIPKTDEERIQNCFKSLKERGQGLVFRKSLKLDGCSHTFAVLIGDQRVDKLTDDPAYPYNLPDEKQIVVCSRNHVLKSPNPDDEGDLAGRSHYWDALINMGWIDAIEKAGYPNIAIQSECMGPGIQRNREKLQTTALYAFRIWDITNQRFFTDEEFITFTATYGLQTVPQLGIGTIDDYGSVEDFLAEADCKSINHPIAEGIVYKEVNGGTHFKAINNRYLTDCEE